MAESQVLANRDNLLNSWPDVVFPTSLGYVLLNMPGLGGEPYLEPSVSCSCSCSSSWVLLCT